MAIGAKNFLIRSLSGIVYAGLLVGMIVLGPLATAILLALFALSATYEIESNVLKADGKPWKMIWLLDAAPIVCLCFAPLPYEHFLWCLLGWFILTALRFLGQITLNQENPLKSLSIFTFEQFYIGFPLVLLVIAVNYTSFNPWFVICALAMIWINDTGAYIIGSLFGKHKMFPSLSPKKSWEGFFGGLLFNIGAAFIFYYCFHLRYFNILENVQGWIFIGICVTVFATVGDLFESMLKRSLGIKDFGTIIPGHGGILDRIDSLLCVVPALFVAVIIASVIV